jgi:hypothetical protein
MTDQQDTTPRGKVTMAYECQDITPYQKIRKDIYNLLSKERKQQIDCGNLVIAFLHVDNTENYTWMAAHLIPPNVLSKMGQDMQQKFGAFSEEYCEFQRANYQ